MGQLHLVQAGFIKPIFEGVNDAGANLSNLLISSSLNKFNLENSENYVPVHSMYSFFDELNRQEGIADVLDQFSNYIHLARLSQLGKMIAYRPNVYSAIQLAVKYDGVIATNEQAGFEINGIKSKYWQRFTDSQSNGREQADFISFALALKGFQLAAGNDWAPLEIHLQSNTSPNLDVLLPSSSHTKILLGQTATAIVFPTSMLTMPMLGLAVHSELVEEFPKFKTYASKIDNLLSSLEPNLIADLNLIAQITETPVRTMQRRLSEEGTSISKVIDQWRFIKAIQLLENAELRVKDIYEQLGYANAPNFMRAFRRWTGVTPMSYRDQ
ncbi:MAG: AraC family transcriptional regulator [Gammaproteobacteria bacterium]|nr:AraC family transcriptional regulator [Gammaproteobacteria bacterium]